MRRRIKILVVDDAVATRRMLCDELAADAAVELVGIAADARQAAERLGAAQSDCAIVGADMAACERARIIDTIRLASPGLPVVLFNPCSMRLLTPSHDRSDDGEHLEHAPARAGVLETQRFIRRELIPAILSLCHVPSDVALHPPIGAAAIAIGASTGGINALTTLLPALPATLDAPVLIVQHMPATVITSVVHRLGLLAQLPIVETRAGDLIRPGRAYVASGDAHFGVQRRGDEVTATMMRTAPENSCRPSVDVLFRAMSIVYGPQTLGVVLSGMGQDGLKGSEAIVQAGGRVIVQDEASCVVWGMPGLIAKAGLADAALPPDELAAEMIRRVAVVRRTAADAEA